ncbi:carboxylesterase/lipase family protein [Nocardia brasiliensis]|uniref:carboxylesterase/lipase family protein n=1 Tax=Nocardia brasiliensis TaxID=37326 RepID=UPI003D8C3649
MDDTSNHLGRRGFLGLTGLGAAGLMAATACTDEPTTDTVVTTTAGDLRGATTEGGLVWKGIPFAAPPTGERRFAPPQPPQPWTGVRNATRFGHAAPQEPIAPGLPNIADQSEDCLYLNVWSPSTNGRHAVIVWIHGGAFVMGSGSQELYDGTHYLENDCVLVTLNYRLGAFGCLYQPDRPGSGNLRLLDQIAALRWVRENIAAFGGDPDNVTVMGESAGAMSIGALLGIPDARTLFRRAILASGGPRPVRTPAEAAPTTAAVQQILGLADPAALRDVPTADLLRASTQVKDDVRLLEPFPHVIDGVVLTEHPLKTVDGSVDLLIGTCAIDVFIPNPAEQARFETLARTAVGAAQWTRILDIYQDTALPGRDPLIDALAGWFVVMPSIWLTEHAHRAGASVWQYTFDYAAASPQGAIHGSDVPYTFSNLDHTANAAAHHLSTTMVASFATFARTGNPSLPELPAWPAFTPDSRACMSFDDTPRVTDDRLPAARRAAWADTDPYNIC